MDFFGLALDPADPIPRPWADIVDDDEFEPLDAPVQVGSGGGGPFLLETFAAGLLGCEGVFWGRFLHVKFHSAQLCCFNQHSLFFWQNNILPFRLVPGLGVYNLSFEWLIEIECGDQSYLSYLYPCLVLYM